MDETSDILALTKLLEIEKQADSGSSSSKFIIDDAKNSSEQPLFLKNINKSLDLIVKKLKDKEQKTEEKNKSSDSTQQDLKKSTSSNKQKTTKLSSILTEVEKQRYKSIFEILGNTLEIGKFAKGPEANRLITPSISGREDVRKILPTTISKVESPKRSSLLEAIAAAALAYNVFAKNVSGTLQSVYRVLKKSISGIFNTGKNLFTRLSSFGKTLFSVFSKLSSVVGFVIKTIGSIIGSIGGVGSAIVNQFSKLKSSSGEVFSSLKNTFKSYIDDILKFFSNLVPAGLMSKLRPSAPPPGNVPGPVRTPTTPPKTSLLQRIPGAPTITKAAEKVKGVAIDPILKLLKGIFPAMGGAKGVLKGIGKAMNNPIIKRLPIVAPLLEVFFGKGDIEQLKQRRASNDIATDEELYRLAGQRVIKGVGGLIGGASGALLLSGLPFFGTLAGGLIGDILGRLGAVAVTNYLLPPEQTTAIGRMVVDSPLKEEELQDFLVKGDRVYKFNNKDEVLGMKEGGAVNSLISSITNTNEKQFSISSRQVKILEEIRDGIKSLILKDSNSINNNYRGGRENNSRPSVTPFNLRSEFDSMNNIATI